MPTPTPTYSPGPELGPEFGVVLVVLALGLGALLGVGGGVAAVLAGYATGLREVDVVPRALLSWVTGDDRADHPWYLPLALEFPAYVALGAFYLAAPLVAAFVLPDGTLPGPQLAGVGVLAYTGGVVAVVWAGAVLGVWWLAPERTTEPGVLASLLVAPAAATLVPFRLFVVTGEFQGLGTLQLPLDVLLGVLALLGLASAPARRVDVLPEPGERRYAAAVLGLGVAVALLGAALGVVAGPDPPPWLFGWPAGLVLLGGVVIVVGALAALGTVE
jgi:hypothetical protein